jgi:hypothetical protein
MIPKKIIFYTRAVQVHFHMALARVLQKEFPDAKVLFVSFFSHAIELAEQAGFATLYFPDSLTESRSNLIADARVAEIDDFCNREYVGLNAMLHMERFLPAGREARQAFLMQHLTVLDSIIEPQTLSISSMYDHFIYVAAGLLALQKQGGHFAFVGCGVPSGRVIGFRTPAETWQNLASTETPGELFRHAVKEIKLPSEERICYMKPLERKRVSFGKRVQKAKQIAAYNHRDYEAGSYFVDKQRNWLFNAIEWRYKAMSRPKLDSVWDIVSDVQIESLEGPCVFLALHMEPEATIYMYSPRWRNQLEVCRLVAEALPIGFTLLVKENPKMVGKRPAGYYDQIRQFPNVRLVSIAVSSSKLIERSEAVVSLAGTVTVEARLRGKLAFCFGKPPFYRFASHYGAQLLDDLNALIPEVGANAGDELAGDSPDWQHWIQGTFVGKGGKTTFNEEMGVLCWGTEDENVHAHCNFIIGALS